MLQKTDYMPLSSKFLGIFEELCERRMIFSALKNVKKVYISY